ncbi:MAG: hypothetical protein IIB94_14600 [Candidatus Marinimicrobia bacterium]|nr:hypothetical protein [Candidatus Neomarinimicrobiota bacterium]
MRQIKIIIFAITFFYLESSIVYACPGCSQAIAESGGTGGLIAIYSLLAGMPFLIIGSIIAGIVYSNRKSNDGNEDLIDSDFLQNGGK